MAMRERFPSEKCGKAKASRAETRCEHVSQKAERMKREQQIKHETRSFFKLKIFPRCNDENLICLTERDSEKAQLRKRGIASDREQSVGNVEQTAPSAENLKAKREKSSSLNG